MAKVIVTLEIEAECSDADLFGAVESVLDGGLPQDAFGESGHEIQMSCIEAVAVLRSPERELLDLVAERLNGLDHSAGGAAFKGSMMLELDLIRAARGLT